MPTWALAPYALCLALSVGGRALVRLGRTGPSELGGRRGSVGWIGGVLFDAAAVLASVAPALDGTLEPVAIPDRTVGHASGFALFVVGLAGTLLAQARVGTSRRTGVDEAGRNDFVVRGPLALVRNPIFSVKIPAFLGLALLVPNAAAIAGFAALVSALELQVRFVEEPYLLRAHGTDYAAYASRVGRFVPGVGCLGDGRVR